MPAPPAPISAGKSLADRPAHRNPQAWSLSDHNSHPPAYCSTCKSRRRHRRRSGVSLWLGELRLLSGRSNGLISRRHGAKPTVLLATARTEPTQRAITQATTGLAGQPKLLVEVLHPACRSPHRNSGPGSTHNSKDRIPEARMTNAVVSVHPDGKRPAPGAEPSCARLCAYAIPSWRWPPMMQ